MRGKWAEEFVNLEFWVVLTFLLASMIWTPLTPAAVIAAAFFWPFRWLATRRISRRTAVDFPIIILVLASIITMQVTATPQITNLQAFRLLAGIGLFFAVVNWGVTARRVRMYGSGIISAGLLLALAAPLTVEWSVGKLAFLPASLYQGFVLLVSDTIHPNVLAGNLALILPIALAYGLFHWGKLQPWERLLVSLASVLMLVVIVITQSRGAWMATAAVFVFLPVLRWRRGWIFLLLAIIASAALVIYIGLPRSLEVAMSGATATGLSGRLEIWSRAIYMIQDFPFTGIGMGSFLQVIDNLYPLLLGSPGSVFHAHNLFLQIAVDLGLPALVAWLSILFISLILSWQLFRAGIGEGDTLFASLGGGFLGSLLALMVHGFTDAVTWGMVRPAPLVWAIWGMIAASANFYLAKARVVS